MRRIDKLIQSLYSTLFVSLKADCKVDAFSHSFDLRVMRKRGLKDMAFSQLDIIQSILDKGAVHSVIMQISSNPPPALRSQTLRPTEFILRPQSLQKGKKRLDFLSFEAKRDWQWKVMKRLLRVIPTRGS